MLLEQTGRLYQELGDYPKALDAYVRSLKVRERALELKIFGSDEEQIADSQHNIATIYARMRRDDDVMYWLIKSLSIVRKSKGPRSNAAAIRLSEIGTYYLRKGDAKLSLQYYQDALDLNP